MLGVFPDVYLQQKTVTYTTLQCLYTVANIAHWLLMKKYTVWYFLCGGPMYFKVHSTVLLYTQLKKEV